MKRFLSIPCLFMALASLGVTVCWADEATDAINLLATSLKCPIKPYKMNSGELAKTWPMMTHDTHTWLGTKRELKIHTKQHSFSDRPPSETDTTARFDDLVTATVTVHTADYDGRTPAVEISCLSEIPKLVRDVPPEANCIKTISWTMLNGQKRVYFENQWIYITIPVCDRETAENVKAAIDALIKLNKERH